MFPSYCYADIGHASIAKSEAFYILPKLNNRANGFVPRYELLAKKRWRGEWTASMR
jgi:hypothetical protein